MPNQLPRLRTTIVVQIPGSEIPALLDSLDRPYYFNWATGLIIDWETKTETEGVSVSASASLCKKLSNLEQGRDIVIDDIDDLPEVRAAIKQAHLSRKKYRLIFTVPNSSILSDLNGFAAYHRWSPLNSHEVETILRDRGIYSEELYRASLGLYQEELKSVLEWSDTPAEFVPEYKKGKLRGKGVAQLPPPATRAAGVENVDAVFERLLRLLEPEARALQLPFPKGMILLGPPGTGKTLTAKNAAAILGVELITVSLGNLMSPIPGQSEENLQSVFDLAEAAGVSVLYFDDMDKAFSSSDLSRENALEKRLMGMLLTQLQESQSLVFTIVTCNRVVQLPPEFVRRFEYKFLVDLPPEGGIYNIFCTHLERFCGEVPRWCDDEDENRAEWKTLILKYEQCTPAEIENAVIQASIDAYLQGTPKIVTHAMLMEQRSKFTPSNIANSDHIKEIQNNSKHYPTAASEDESVFAWKISKSWQELTTGTSVMTAPIHLQETSPPFDLVQELPSSSA
jgi:DNA polymerase III delta prime subunit